MLGQQPEAPQWQDATATESERGVWPSERGDDSQQVSLYLLEKLTCLVFIPEAQRLSISVPWLRCWVFKRSRCQQSQVSDQRGVGVGDYRRAGACALRSHVCSGGQK